MQPYVTTHAAWTCCGIQLVSNINVNNRSRGSSNRSLQQPCTPYGCIPCHTDITWRRYRRRHCPVAHQSCCSKVSEQVLRFECSLNVKKLKHRQTSDLTRPSMQHKTVAQRSCRRPWSVCWKDRVRCRICDTPALRRDMHRVVHLPNLRTWLPRSGEPAEMLSGLRLHLLYI